MVGVGIQQSIWVKDKNDIGTQIMIQVLDGLSLELVVSSVPVGLHAAPVVVEHDIAAARGWLGEFGAYEF